MEIIQTARSPRPIGPYSQGVRSGDFVFVVGQGSLDPATGKLPAGIKAQTPQVLRNIRGILEAGGATMSHVVKVTAHLADLNDFDAFNGVYKACFWEPNPVRTAVGSQLLGILVELDPIAGYRGER